MFQHPPPLIQLLGHVATHDKRHSNERQKSLPNWFGHFFRSGQRSGHQRSSKVKLYRFKHFFYKYVHNPGAGRAAPRKSAFDSSFDVLSLACPHVWSKINGLAFREQKLKKSRFTKNKNKKSGDNFSLSEDLTIILRHRVSLVKTRQMNYNLILKGHVESLTSGVMTWSGKVMLHINRSVSSSSTHLRCFHRFSLFLSKIIAEKTAGDLSWPEMTLETWWGVQYSDSGCQAYL